ncbi:hypothetical protein OIE62_27920 [Streptomyces scopuliridis]|uniref:DUF5709 domain-containing protein n=2 Tax=Streptomyces scopuliridis TaxID=452529 RepID=A0A2T7T447_9ACTN|nr:hypothetical protein [Streptomyces scopuliridis]PVE09892.1 hypothetical protein Y717_28775 [Streptomyces scopuliridis RB72]WSB33572.1 hypothetical protein OG949_12315 [Streptomyces scopuliridis]WSB97846.1 hypothetical protein OG835_13020 [Streptomyces scopuliridis]WSC08451.1 hypothetical protein OIE62_27920 [Streptomyces scopuliridis]
MAVDPTDPETFETNGEQEAAELDEEVPEADAAEQHTDVRPKGDEPLTRIDRDGADEADAADQARAVGTDEDDDYRP